MEIMVKDKVAGRVNLFTFFADPKKDDVVSYTPRPVPAGTDPQTGAHWVGWDGDHGFNISKVVWYHMEDRDYAGSLVREAPEAIKVRAMEIRKHISALLSTETI